MPKEHSKKFHSFTHEEIQRLYRRARYILSDSRITVRAAKTQSEFGRLLIVIPKRVGKAVRRNLLRRRIKSIFREQQLYAHGYDFIVTVKPAGAALSFQELQGLLTQACLPLLP